jgi:hypothetical protein
MDDFEYIGFAKEVATVDEPKIAPTPKPSLHEKGGH